MSFIEACSTLPPPGQPCPDPHWVEVPFWVAAITPAQVATLFTLAASVWGLAWVLKQLRRAMQ